MKLFVMAVLLLAVQFAFADQFLTQNFGPVPVNSYSTARFLLRAGSQPVETLFDYRPFSPFDVRNYCPRILPPFRSCPIDVVYWPARPGQDFGRYDLQLRNERITIDLFGSAY